MMQRGFTLFIQGSYIGIFHTKGDAMRKPIGAALVIIALTLSGCGTRPADRVLSGAGIGAAAGAVFGALAGAPATGAAIGAAVGGVAGGVTSPSRVDLGKPIWRQ